MINKTAQNYGLQTRSVSREAGLKLIALLEGAKGALVLCAGSGLLILIHKDLHLAASRLINYIHLNPASKYPSIFLDLVDRTNDSKLWAMAIAAAIYSAVRFAEAIGLWYNRRWAEWFGFLSSTMYLPLEIFELTKGVSWPKVTVLTVNVVVVMYLLYILLNHRSAPRVFQDDLSEE